MRRPAIYDFETREELGEFPRDDPRYDEERLDGFSNGYVVIELVEDDGSGIGALHPSLAIHNRHEGRRRPWRAQGRFTTDPILRRRPDRASR